MRTTLCLASSTDWHMPPQYLRIMPFRFPSPSSGCSGNKQESDHSQLLVCCMQLVDMSSAEGQHILQLPEDSEILRHHLELYMCLQCLAALYHMSITSSDDIT